MTDSPSLRVAVALGRRFGLKPMLLARSAEFRLGVDEALILMDEAEVVEQIVAGGGLTAAVNSYGVVIARVRRLADDARTVARLAADEDEARRWRQVDAAARRGETLRRLVNAGRLFGDEAEAMLGREFGDDTLRSIGLAALQGETP